MIQPSFPAVLMAAVGGAALPQPRLSPAGRTAVALAVITRSTDKKQRVADLAQAHPRA